MKDHMLQALITTPKFKDIRAKLREAMFQILSQKDQYQTTNFFAKHFLSTDDGHLIGGIIKDYLECLQLNYTLSVFATEAGGLSKVYSREKIEKTLNKQFTEGIPILFTLLAKENANPSTKGKIPNLSIPTFKPKNNLLDLLERPKEGNNERLDQESSDDEMFDDEDIDFQDLLQVPEDVSSEEEKKPVMRKKSF